MHPSVNQGRRQARVAHLRAEYHNKPDTRYTDFAPYPARLAHALVVVDSNSATITSLTLPHVCTTTAEERATALAATTASSDYVAILTDSQQACCNYCIGRISPSALKILASIKNPPQIQTVWTPGHSSLEGNEVAHAAARDITLRAFSSTEEDLSAASTYPPVPSQYTEILYHYRQL